MNSKFNVIDSLNKELNIKHLIIIKEDDFSIDQGISHFAKKIMQGNIFVSFMSVPLMSMYMHDYYKTPLGFYKLQSQAKRMKLEKIRDAWVYPPKTIVTPYGERMKFKIGKLFTVRE